MKLEISDFKSISKKGLDLGDKGVVLISGKSGTGKCLGYGTPILLYSGKIKPVQNINTDDVLMGDDSSPRTVLSTVTGMEKLYTIYPEKGSSFKTTGDHILVCSKITKHGMKTVEIKTSDLLSIFNLNPKKRGKYFLIHQAVKFSDTISLKPSDIAALPLSASDKEVSYQEIVSLINIYVSDNYDKFPDLCKYGSFLTRLTTLKHIVLTSRYSIHISEEKRYYIKVKNSSLSNFLKEVQYLALSLGFFSDVVKNRVSIYGEVFKLIEFLPIQNNKECYQNFQIYEELKEYYYGFELDGNKRFLLGDFTVSHNSSILDSVNYALYGEGKDIIRYGEKTCTVNLQIDNLNITRNKKPNKLSLTYDNEKYEGTVAQNIISNKLGKNFKTTSYLTQDMDDAFMKLTPAGKLSFLESMIMTDTNLEDVNKKIKALIKDREENITKVKSKVELTRKILSEMKDPTEVKFPVNISDSKRELYIKNEKIRKQNSSVLITRANKMMSEIKLKLEKSRVLEAQHEQNIEEKDKLVEEISSKKLSLSEVSQRYKGVGYLKILKNKLSYLDNYSELLKLKKEYKEHLERYSRFNEDNLLELAKIESELWKEYTEVECVAMIDDYKDYISDITEIEKLSKELSSLAKDISFGDKEDKNYESRLISDNERISDILSETKQIEDKLRYLRETYICPNCNICLKLDKKKLVLLPKNNSKINNILNEDDLISTLKSLLEEKDMLESDCRINKKIHTISSKYEKLEKLSDIKQELEEIENYYSKNQKLLQRKQSLLNNTILVKMKNGSDKLCKRIEEKEDLLSTDNNLKDLTEDDFENKDKITKDISEQESFKKEIQHLNTFISCLEDKLKVVEKKLDVELEDISKLEEAIKTQEKVKEEELSNFRKHTRNLEIIERWKKYVEQKEKYNSVKRDLTSLETEEKLYQDRLGGALLLKEKVKEAEGLALSELLNSINNHAKVFLESFFEDRDISVELVAFKESKLGNKPCINVKVEYDGNDMELNSLSGGEKDRVILAFTLALSEINSSPFVMIDEGLRSLDNETANKVVKGIKENTDKLVLIVAHQIIKAQFDKVIDIEE